MWSRPSWTWEEIFAVLSRERELSEPLCIDPAWVEGGLEAAGAIAIPDSPGRFSVSISDGSELIVADDDGRWSIQLVAAPLPTVHLDPHLPGLAWLALPAGLFLLGALGVIA